MFSSEPRFRSHSPAFFYNPWFYFPIFTIANAILSYAAPSRILLPFSGISLLVFWLMALFFFSKKIPTNPIYQEEVFSTLSPGLWGIIALLAFLPRLYILFNPTWPTPDDGINAFIAQELSRKWSWYFFLTHSQSPPLNSWIQTLYFKCVTPSFFSMRLFFFILSITSGFLSFSVAKTYFSRSTALFCFIFGSLSFWPLYASRFWMYPQTLFTFQLLVFGMLGVYLKSASIRDYQINGWKLGLITGLGFWMAIQWPLAAFAITLACFLNTQAKELKTTFSRIASYGLSLTLIVFPFLLASLAQKNGENIKYLFALSPVGGISRLNSFLSNGTSLFWGCDLQNSYGPVWGGMLNPIAASLFFIGFIELIRHQSFQLPRWVLWSLFIFMLPGLLTGTFDLFRNSLVLPLALLICALGAQSISRHTSARWRTLLLIVILLASTCLDMVHLWKTYQPAFSTGSNLSTNSPAFPKAFEALKKINDQKGPGNIFWGFNTDISDPTLDVATYAFNSAENPNLSSENAQWTAFITNANYQPFLSDRFPDAKFYWLGPDTFWNQGGLMLVLILKDNKNQADLTRWNSVNDQFHSVTRDYLLNPLSGQEKSRDEKLESIEKLISGDRFLESIFYEKLIYFQRSNPDKQQLITLIQLAVKKGCPASHLWVTKGLLLQAVGNKVEARKAFEKAVHSRLNLTDAKKNLEILNGLEKAE